MKYWLIISILLLQATAVFAAERNVDVNFKPRLVKTELTADRLRPGDTLFFTLHFVNEGTAAAKIPYNVFVHCEPAQSCAQIVADAGHEPEMPTTLWAPGKQIADGPRGLTIPSNLPAGKYWLHVGVYVWEPQHVRFCEAYAAQFTVDPEAPLLRDQRAPLPAATVAQRRAQLAARIKNAAVLESAHLRLRMDPATGSYDILDKTSGVRWNSHPFQPRFGTADVRVGERRERLFLEHPRIQRAKDRLQLTFRGSGDSAASVAVTLRLLPDGRTLEYTWAPGKGTTVDSIRLLDDALWVTDADRGSVLVPARTGLMIPSDNGRMFRNSFPTSSYEGCHMQMLGILKAGAAALVTWEDPYATPEVSSTLTESENIPGRQVLATSMLLRNSARVCRVSFLGKGDAATIARAYRQTPHARAMAQTWDMKIRRNPEAGKLIGAINVKLWSTLARSIGEDGKERSHTVNWTFDEAAQVAEHLKRDLQLDHVLFILGGWIHRGYDNQHPDILPTAPECGGDERFVAATRRIKAQGYLLGLHDNYQDMYRDSPSWDERHIMKDAQGNLVKGGKWAGGQAWLTCSPEALELAKRPQNLKAVHALSGSAAYFIDTTYAAGLYECFDPRHPLTRVDDIKYKCALSDYARNTFGLFGSEDGREWAIPHADFFEGITGVSGRFYHNNGLLDNLGATPIPLFEMVYHDCIAAYGKYGYAPQQAAGYVLHHLILGRTLNYHSVNPHLYWKHEEAPLPVTPGVALLEATGPRTFRVQYSWKVDGPVSEDWRAFIHFVDANGKILFQDDSDFQIPTSRWKPGVILSTPHEVTVPAAVNGSVFVQMGLFQPATDARAMLHGTDTERHSYRIGTLQLPNSGPRFLPLQQTERKSDPGCFVRADGGWAEGMTPADCFMKNTYEILSPLQELTARMLLTKHEFLTADRRVQRSTFGGKIQVTVNEREENYTIRRADGQEVILPPFGFLVEAPQFTAFHALSWGGIRYDQPVLFTLRSQDGQPLAKSKKVRVYHGFGDPRCDLFGRTVTVKREAIIQ